MITIILSDNRRIRMFDLERAVNCASKMKEYFTSVEQDANILVPSTITLGTTEYFLYLFYSCLLDYGMRSKIYHSNLVQTYQDYKEIFDPSYVVSHYLEEEGELFTIIKENIHPRYPNVALKKWISLSKYLNDNYPGNKLKEKILSLPSYSELYRFITDIRGYGQKTGGLLLRLIYESGIGDFQGSLDHIPMDRHDIEISYLNGIITKEKLTNTEIKELGSTWIKAALKNNISACDMDKYLWTIGNQLCSKKECEECPIHTTCKKKG